MTLTFLGVPASVYRY